MNKFKFSNYKLPHMKGALLKTTEEVQPEINRNFPRLENRMPEGEGRYKASTQAPKPLKPMQPNTISNAAGKLVVGSSGGRILDNVDKVVSDYESQFDKPEFKEFIEKEREGYGADEFKRMYAVVEPGGKYRLKDLSGDMEHVSIPEGMKYPQSEEYLRSEAKKNLQKRDGYFSDKAFMSNY